MVEGGPAVLRCGARFQLFIVLIGSRERCGGRALCRKSVVPSAFPCNLRPKKFWCLQRFGCACKRCSARCRAVSGQMYRLLLRGGAGGEPQRRRRPSRLKGICKCCVRLLRLLCRTDTVKASTSRSVGLDVAEESGGDTGRGTKWCLTAFL